MDSSKNKQYLLSLRKQDNILLFDYYGNIIRLMKVGIKCPFVYVISYTFTNDTTCA